MLAEQHSEVPGEGAASRAALGRRLDERLDDAEDLINDDAGALRSLGRLAAAPPRRPVEHTPPRSPAIVASIAAGEGAPVEPDDLRNIEETARFFDVTPPTVRGWIADDCPVWRKGGNGVGYALSLRAVAGWRQGRADAASRREIEKAEQAAQLRLELLGGDGLAGEEAVKLTPKQQGEALAAELARVRLAKERGELVRAASVQLDLLRGLTLIRDRVRGLPDRLATALGWREEETHRCVEAIDDFLEELAAEGEQIFNEAMANAHANA